MVVLIPAHNEEACLSSAISSVLAQSRVPDEVVVVLDNCEDTSEEIAASFYPAVLRFKTQDNDQKKAGALNQVISLIADLVDDDDLLMVMDADSELDPHFIANAEGAMESDVGAVGGVFLGKPAKSILQRLQSSEYSRYSREIARSKGAARVITGTAALFRVAALRDIVAARNDGRLPGGRAQVYDTLALTEDNELTLALKHLGYRCVSPKGCRVYTDLMESVPQLYHQRLRWQRGAVDNLRNYGATKVTRPYIVRQLLMGLGIPVNLLFWFMVAYSLILLGRLEFKPFWMWITAIFLVERVWTVRSLGPKAMVISLTMIPEMIYDAFQQYVFVIAAFKSIRRSDQAWAAT